ncbi:hypothetical protein A2U01_0112325, partial [Trifolium medium]|nr:hypothetical protein [Trifolium medium]
MPTTGPSPFRAGFIALFQSSWSTGKKEMNDKAIV